MPFRVPVGSQQSHSLLPEAPRLRMLGLQTPPIHVSGRYHHSDHSRERRGSGPRRVPLLPLCWSRAGVSVHRRRATSRARGANSGTEFVFTLPSKGTITQHCACSTQEGDEGDHPEDEARSPLGRTRWRDRSAGGLLVTAQAKAWREPTAALRYHVDLSQPKGGGNHDRPMHDHHQWH
jgi:hypothetical protein